MLEAAEALKVLEVSKVMRRALLRMLEAMEGRLCLLGVLEMLEVLEVLEVSEAMRYVRLCMLETVEDELCLLKVMRCVLLCILVAVRVSSVSWRHWRCGRCWTCWTCGGDELCATLRAGGCGA